MHGGGILMMSSNAQQVHPLPFEQLHKTEVSHVREGNALKHQAKMEENVDFNETPRDIMESEINYIEEEGVHPLLFTRLHLLEQFGAKNVYQQLKAKQKAKSGNGDIKDEIHLESYHSSKISETLQKRAYVYVTIAVTDLLNVDVVNESFTIKFRFYAFWRSNIHEFGFEELANKAFNAKDEYYLLSRPEVNTFVDAYPIPQIFFFNQVSKTENDPFDIRIYGGHPEHTAIMINQSVTLVCRSKFSLYDFPFDMQYIHLECGFNDSYSWLNRKLCIHLVQFHQQSIPQLEWFVYVPLVQRITPKHAKCQIVIPLQRKSMYYILNVLIILIILCFLSLIVFAFENNDIGGRSAVVLTLILTFIAFKFTVMSSIPRVSYTTILDYFMLYGLWILSLMTIIAIIPNFFVSSDMTTNSIDSIINWSLLWVAVGSMILGYASLMIYAYLTYRSHQRYHIRIPVPPEHSFLEQLCPVLIQKANAARAVGAASGQKQPRRGSIFRESFYGSVKLVSSKLVSTVSFRQANDSNGSGGGNVAMLPKVPISWYGYRYSNPWFLPDPDTSEYKFFDAKYSSHPDIS